MTIDVMHVKVDAVCRDTLAGYSYSRIGHFIWALLQAELSKLRSTLEKGR